MAGEGVHRLKDIVVEEVSLVDRAANGQKFLVVKRQGEDMTLQPNGRGGFTKVAKEDAPPTAGEKDDVDKAKGKPFPGAAKPFGSKDEPKEEPKEAKKADPEGMKLADQLGTIAQTLSDLAADLTDEEEDEPNDVHMKKIADAAKTLEKFTTKKDTAKAETESAPVAKIGAKMSAANLSLMTDALESLSQLMSNIVDSPAKEKTHEPDAGDPQTKPAGFSESNPSDAPSDATGQEAMKVIGKQLDDAKETIRKQAARLEEMSKVVQPSLSQPVEKSGARVTKAADPWPLDMNGPRASSGVEKRITFADE